MPYLLINGLKLHYVERGSGEPVLLLEGAYGTAETQWLEQTISLSKEFKCIAFDFRGHGKSELPPNEITRDLLVEDTLKFLDCLSIDKIHLCGFSLGASVAMRLSLILEERVKSLILCGSFYKKDRKVRSGVAASRRRRRDLGWPEALNTEYLTRGKNHLEDLSKLLSKGFSQDKDFPLENLSRISCPTLLAIGDHDEYVDLRQSIKMHANIPNSELLIVPNCNHYKLVKSPIFVDASIDFLRRQTADSRK